MMVTIPSLEIYWEELVTLLPTTAELSGNSPHLIAGVCDFARIIATLILGLAKADSVEHQ